VFGHKRRDAKDRADRGTVSDWLTEVGGTIDDRNKRPAQPTATEPEAPPVAATPPAA
jgi:hypothetical protein